MVEVGCLIGDGSKEFQVGILKFLLMMSLEGEEANLGRSISAYRGHITRIIGQLEPLFSQQVASDEVVEKHSSLVSIFEKLKRASAQWYHLGLQPEDRERISLDYAKDVYRMQLFEDKYKEWLYNVYTPVRRGAYEEGIVNISGFELKSKAPFAELEEEFQEIQDANAVDNRAAGRSVELRTGTPNVFQDARGGNKAPSQLCPGEKSSKQGSQLSARNVKCAMAQLKVKRLLAEQEIKETEIALHLQEENLRLFAKKERLNIRSEVMLVRFDAEQAEIEAELGEQVDYDAVFSSEGSVRGHENVKKYLEELSFSAVPRQAGVEGHVISEAKRPTLPEVKEVSEAKNFTGNSIAPEVKGHVSGTPFQGRHYEKRDFYDETTDKFQRMMEQQRMSMDKVVVGLEKLHHLQFS